MPLKIPFTVANAAEHIRAIRATLPPDPGHANHPLLAPHLPFVNRQDLFSGVPGIGYSDVHNTYPVGDPHRGAHAKSMHTYVRDKALMLSTFQTSYMSMGIAYEDYAIEMVRERLGGRLQAWIPQVALVHPRHRFLRGVCDMLVVVDGRLAVVEIKTMPKREPVNVREGAYGIEADTEREHESQLQCYLDMFDAEEGWIAQFKPPTKDDDEPMLYMTHVKRDLPWFEEHLKYMRAGWEAILAMRRRVCGMVLDVYAAKELGKDRELALQTLAVYLESVLPKSRLKRGAPVEWNIGEGEVVLKDAALLMLVGARSGAPLDVTPVALPDSLEADSVGENLQGQNPDSFFQQFDDMATASKLTAGRPIRTTAEMKAMLDADEVKVTSMWMAVNSYYLININFPTGVGLSMPVMTCGEIKKSAFKSKDGGGDKKDEKTKISAIASFPEASGVLLQDFHRMITVYALRKLGMLVDTEPVPPDERATERVKDAYLEELNYFKLYNAMIAGCPNPQRCFINATEVTTTYDLTTRNPRTPVPHSDLKPSEGKTNIGQGLIVPKGWTLKASASTKVRGPDVLTAQEGGSCQIPLNPVMRSKYSMLIFAKKDECDAPGDVAIGADDDWLFETSAPEKRTVESMTPEERIATRLSDGAATMEDIAQYTQLGTAVVRSLLDVLIADQRVIQAGDKYAMIK
jgi:hypothetical protein